MSLHNFNSNTKSWKMYTNTLTSVSGDDLLVMPSYGKDLILEVSANNEIFFKKGTITKRFDNLVSDYLDKSFNSLNSQVQYILQEISGASVKDFITSGISNDLLIKSYAGRDIILEVSGNSEIIFKRGDFSYNLDDLIGGGSQSSDYATYNILDITGKIIFTDNSGTSGGGTSGGGSSGSSSNIVLTSINGNIIPSTDNTFKLGDVSKNWSNAYITDISVSNINVSENIILNICGGSITNINKLTAPASDYKITSTTRLYQEISGDISWNAVNGYYGLAKDAYPGLNPYSSGAKAVSNWTGRSEGVEVNGWNTICWSPELRIFVAVADGTRSNTNNIVMTSSNGTSWTSISGDAELIGWTSVCWSSELKIFVAVAQSGLITNKRVMYSTNGTSWTGTLEGVDRCSWSSVCWSPELKIFVAVASGGLTNTRVMYSANGTSWTSTSNGVELNQWYSVCWSPELGIFVAVASFNGATTNKVMTSSNGTSWTVRSQGVEPNNWFSVCWSPELGIFVALAYSGTTSNRVMTSANGTNWTSWSQGIELTNWQSICWSSELGIFVAVAYNGNNRVMYSTNGTSWTSISGGVERNSWTSVCWSSELGIFAAVGLSGANRVMTSSLKGRPPTSYNVFDSSFNSIDESGNWTFSNISIVDNLVPVNDLYSNLGLETNRWNNAYINALNVTETVTFGGSNLYVPSSFTIDPLGHGDNTGTVLINGNLVVQGVTTTINSTVVDISDKMLVLASNASNSLQADGAGFEISGAKVNFLYNNSSATFRSSIGISISGNVVPVSNSVGSLGSSSLSWSNAYIRDVSTTNIEVSGNIVPLLDLSSSLGSSLKRWTRVFVDDLSVNKINGQAYSASGGGGSSTALTSDVSANSINTNTFNIQGSLNITNNEQLINRIGQIIPSEGTNDKAGWSVAINDIGDIIAIGATRAGAPGQVSQSGHVRVYKYNGSIWVQQGDDMDTNRGFAYAGWSVSLNSAGNIVAMGAPNAGDSESAVGMVRVYKYNNVSWIQEGLDIYGELNYDWSGGSGLTYSGYGPGTAVSLNSAGNIVAIGSTENIDGKGHVRVYQNNSGTWTLIGTDIDGEFNNDRSGFAVSLNSDGTVLAVGSPGQDSGSNPSGIVRVYKWNGSTWGKRGLNIGGETLGDKSGIAVSINSVGDIVAIGGPFNDGAGTDSGHVRVYKWNNVSWQQLGVLDIDGENASDKIGFAVSLNSAGDTLAIGVPYNTNTKLGSDTGCVRIYKYNGINWIKQGITIEGLMTGGNFGWATALNAAGNRVVIGAPEAAYGNGHSMVYEFSIGPPVILSNNILPLANNSYSLGTTANRWSNAYINNIEVNGNITVSNRIYQEFNYHSNWNAVNGHLGLAKDAYPALNPYSSGLKAFQTWTPKILPVDATWNSVAWSPLLQRFVAVGERQYIITSTDGITWNQITGNNINCENWRTVCWSPQLRLFVAFGANSDFRTMWSSNGIDWTQSSFNHGNFWNSICWSPELATFFAIGNRDNFIATSTNGINWTGSDITLGGGNWSSICWSAELKLLVAVSSNVGIIISTNGVTWTLVSNVTYCTSVCWSPQLGLFVAVGMDRVVTSSNGTSWRQKTLTEEGNPIYQIYQWLILNSICWCAELRLFVACSTSNAIISSFDGINWTLVTSVPAKSICWSPELGIFVAIGINNMSVTSSLKGRPPTSYNVFDSSFNSIDETGKWTFSNMAVKTLTVTLSFTNNSDDRVKHNEVIINNGLDVIDKLTPKFYQKTLDLLDVSYNGDLSGHTWIYEAGLIAQEVLQVPDLSFAVSGGDYYESVMQYDLSYNDLSYNDLSYNDLRRAIRSGNYYEVSKNLIKQSYGLNYTSVFVYGLAAIKELHQKVKAQETSISSLQTSMLEQQATINSLLTRLQALETNASQ